MNTIDTPDVPAARACGIPQLAEYVDTRQRLASARAAASHQPSLPGSTRAHLDCFG